MRASSTPTGSGPTNASSPKTCQQSASTALDPMEDILCFSRHKTSITSWQFCREWGNEAISSSAVHEICTNIGRTQRTFLHSRAQPPWLLRYLRLKVLTKWPCDNRDKPTDFVVVCSSSWIHWPNNDTTKSSRSCTCLEGLNSENVYYRIEYNILYVLHTSRTYTIGCGLVLGILFLGGGDIFFFGWRWL